MMKSGNMHGNTRDSSDAYSARWITKGESRGRTGSSNQQWFQIEQKGVTIRPQNMWCKTLEGRGECSCKHQSQYGLMSLKPKRILIHQWCPYICNLQWLFFSQWDHICTNECTIFQPSLWALSSFLPIISRQPFRPLFIIRPIPPLLGSEYK